jgi:hypothetical protein
MKPIYAEFWVCAEPEEVTRIMRLQPTSVQLKQPYDYWRFACSTEELGKNCLSALIEILQTREAEILSITSKYTAGVLWVGRIDATAPGYENNWEIEPGEMSLLARLNIPLCIQPWVD